ncbi:MAG: T9SS type A sorting domain-containing protein, partial [Bacteroidetes bacterium]|nr:T9SS type A sorting domain-containing protein [Bacteroidota bacterium]
EWDYDQIRTASIQPDDTLWMYLENRLLAIDISNGIDHQAILSLGPFDLAPDSSARVVYALFGADFVHTDPHNGANLAAGAYDHYLRNLNFEIFRERAEAAVGATDLILDPHRPPTGLQPAYLSGDTVRLSWDPRVFPDITGYNVYLTPVADSYYVAPRMVRQGAEPPDVRLAATVSPAASEVELTGLDPAKYYFASVAHVTADGPGDRSPSVVVGYGNQALIPDTVQMKRYHAFYRPGDTGVVLSWFPSESPDIVWYRIYKASDSAQALGRYAPFLAMDSALSPVLPRRTGRTDGRPWCYYQMQAYDSVPAPQTGYIDTKVSNDGWYWVTAVNKYGDEGPFSRLVSAAQSVAPSRDLLVILSSTGSLHDWVRRDSLFAYYDRLLDGYDYDIYSWADTNRNVHTDDIDYNVNWVDLARYRVILVEEMASPGVLTKWNEPAYHTLERIIASGRDLVYFGTPPGPLDLNLNTNKSWIRCEPTSFESRYFHLDSIHICTWQGLYQTYGVVDSLAGFSYAVPEQPGFPPIAVDTTSDRMTNFIHTLFEIDGYLPLTPGFYPDSAAEVLYRYGSKYPSSSLLDGLPCGLLNRFPGSNVYTFAFHLWAIDTDDARRLIAYVLGHQAPDAALDPYFLPETITLRQNYPNPFNPSTTISFELNRSQHVILEIFDLLGRRTATLLNETAGAGPHVIEWNGRDKNGHEVASGIYFYRLRSDEGSATRKMVLVR